MQHEWKPMADFNPAEYLNTFYVVADCVHGGYQLRFVTRRHDDTYHVGRIPSMSDTKDTTVIGHFVEPTHYCVAFEAFGDQAFTPGDVPC